MNKILSLALDGCGSIKDDSNNEVCQVKPPSENNGGGNTFLA